MYVRNILVVVGREVAIAIVEIVLGAVVVYFGKIAKVGTGVVCPVGNIVQLVAVGFFTVMLAALVPLFCLFVSCLLLWWWWRWQH